MLTSSDAPLLAVFSAVVAHGSITAAARALRLSKSVVSERVSELESRCGVRLLERTTRRMRLTEAGVEAIAAARRIDDAIDSLSRNFDSRALQPSGTLRVATTVDLGPLLVAPTVARFVQRFTNVRVEIVSDDTASDMIEARIDVAVRLGAPKGSTFVARRLARLEEPIVAAPSIAERFSSASSPRELAHAPWVKHSLVMGTTLRFHGPHEARDEVTPRFRAEANNGATLVSLLVHGAGVGVMPEHALREHIRDGRLVHLCPGWSWKSLWLYALTPSTPSKSPASKAFLQALREQIETDRARWSAA
ncbi:MAG: LysR family transcriptional regulator [Polyangiales bacterium]